MSANTIVIVVEAAVAFFLMCLLGCSSTTPAVSPSIIPPALPRAIASVQSTQVVPLTIPLFGVTCSNVFSSISNAYTVFKWSPTLSIPRSQWSVAAITNATQTVTVFLPETNQYMFVTAYNQIGTNISNSPH
jgi:hypothetical protein